MDAVAEELIIDLSGSQLGREEPASMESGIGLTLQRRETTVHDQLKITQLALREHNSGESLSLSDELLLARSIAGNQVLEDTTVRSVGHCRYVCMKENKKTLL